MQYVFTGSLVASEETSQTVVVRAALFEAVLVLDAMLLHWVS